MRFYRFLNLISMDVAAGAMVCAAFFAPIFKMELRTDTLVSLGISVWIIYSADHLLDAYKLMKVLDSNEFKRGQWAALFAL